MKKILFLTVILTLLLSACGGVDELQAEVDGLQAELDLAESTVGLCVISLEEALSTCPETGGGGEGEEVMSECAGTERTLMMSTPVLQQALDKDGDPKYNNKGKMVMIAIDNSRVEDFTAGDVVCVTEHYAVAGGWGVFLISGTREANFNLFIPAHYFELLPEENVPFEPFSGNPCEGRTFSNCTEVCNAGCAPVYEGQSWYQPKFDSDNDGIGCEVCN